MSCLAKSCWLRSCRATRLLRIQHAAHDEGYAVAEFAVVLPALVMLAFGLLSVLGLGAQQISLNARCADITRIIARGDELPDTLIQDRTITINVERHDGLLDVTLSKRHTYSLLSFTQDIVWKAHATALDELASV